MPYTPDDICPCGSGQPYSSCCHPLLQQRQIAETAEQLMRSRYTAHVTGDIDYILATWIPEQRIHLKREDIERWALESEWLGLEVLNRRMGGKTDPLGTVEFIAHYRKDGEEHHHREVSNFRRVGQRWFFVDANDHGNNYGDNYDYGDEENRKPTVKVGRNEPCPCGSGKKFKRCCGA